MCTDGGFSLWGAGAGAGASARQASTSPDDPFTIIYTSGTTGNPKGVILSHRNLTSGVASACRALTLFSSDQQLLFLPLAHVLGRELAWVSVHAGLTTWFAQSVAKLKDDLAEIRPTYMAGVPRVFEKFFAGVQAALTKGSPLARRIAAWALEVGRRCSAATSAGQPIGGWPRLLKNESHEGPLHFHQLQIKLPQFCRIGARQVRSQ